MFRFTIRDVLWLMVVVGLSLGWFIEHRASAGTITRLRLVASTLVQMWNNRDGVQITFENDNMTLRTGVTRRAGASKLGVGEDFK